MTKIETKSFYDDDPNLGAPAIKGHDKRVDFNTGAVRSDSGGKGRPSLLPFDALIELSKHFEEGAKHYEDRNWEKGIPLSRFIDSAFRHMAAIMNGDMDEPHQRAFAWNAVCFLATWIRIENGELPEDLNDLPNIKLTNVFGQ